MAMKKLFAGHTRGKTAISKIREPLLEHCLARLQEHQSDLEQERREFRNVSTRNSDVTDQGTCLETLEDLTRRMSFHSDRIQKIQSVITRIKTDPRWHECEECGELIIDRLLIGRYTALCFSCQEEYENTSSHRYSSKT